MVIVVIAIALVIAYAWFINGGYQVVETAVEEQKKEEAAKPDKNSKYHRMPSVPMEVLMAGRPKSSKPPKTPDEDVT